MPCGRDHRGWMFLDCRHGRALLLGPAGPRREALVWDPMTGARHRAPLPPDAGDDARHRALICCCSHARDCRPSPFQAVLVWWNKRKARCRRAVATLYSSETGAWSQQVFSAPFASTDPEAGDARTKRGGTVVGDICWLLPESRILQFDTTRLSLALISVPLRSVGSPYWQCQLLVTEDGELGLAMAMESSVLVWKRDTSPAAEGWSQHRSVQLDVCLPPGIGTQGVPLLLLGFDKESNSIFVWVDAGMFMVQLNSMQSRTVCQGYRDFEIHPFAADVAGTQAVGDASERVADNDDKDREPEGTPHSQAMEMEFLSMWHYADPGETCTGHSQW